jgi:protein-L-isoaspartate(D-aspartate) O-methyltransferase
MHQLSAQDNMLKRQIREGFVTDDLLLGILKETPRELFVPRQYKDLAYVDMQLPIGHGQVMMRPQEEALIVQALNIKTTDNILEIGTGTGYLTSVLAKLGRHVTSVDIFEDFVEAAKTKLLEQKIENITLATRNVINNWFIETSFDVIICTAALPELPKQYLQTLTLDGRLFAILGEQPIMTATIFHHQTKHFWAKQTLFETEIPIMIGSDKKDKFTF